MGFALPADIVDVIVVAFIWGAILFRSRDPHFHAFLLTAGIFVALLAFGGEPVFTFAPLLAFYAWALLRPRRAMGRAPLARGAS